jgi:hypothetical protein
MDVMYHENGLTFSFMFENVNYYNSTSKKAWKNIMLTICQNTFKKNKIIWHTSAECVKVLQWFWIGIPSFLVIYKVKKTPKTYH